MDRLYLSLLLQLLLLQVVYVQSICPEQIQGLKTWSSSHAVPNGGASVTIAAGEKILWDVDFPTSALSSIVVNGVLVLKPGRDYAINTNKILVSGSGELWIGSEDCPFVDHVVITLYESGTNDNMFGQKYIGLQDNGRLEIHGKPTSNWTHLAVTAKEGATSITLMNSVNWPKGGSIIVVTTDTDYNVKQTEVRNITEVSADGKTVSFETPLKYMHFSDYVGDQIKSFPVRAEVGYINRNILIKGAVGKPLFGGHLMAMSGQMHLSEVEFTQMGQTGLKGRYPVHFHLAGNSMKGSWVRKLAIHDNFQRCVTIHGTHNITVEGVTAYNNRGHCYFVEDGNEKDNWFINNLGVNALSRENGDGMLASDFMPSIFWITNPQNNLVGNAAASAAKAIWMAFPLVPYGAVSGQWDSMPIEDVDVQSIPLGIFRDNTAHSSQNCLFVDHGPDESGDVGTGSWYFPRNFSTYRTRVISDIVKYADRVTAVFENVTVYKSTEWCVWSRGDSMVYKNINYADCAIGHQFAGVDQRLQDSVMVGKSQNVGSGFSDAEKGRSRPYGNILVPMIGYRFYHAVGPTAISHVHFSNFFLEHFDDLNITVDAAAIGTESGFNSIYIGRSRFYGVTFNKVDVPFLVNRGSSSKGDKNANMIDTDGTLTGVCGTQIIATPSWIRYDGDAQCTFHPTWNAYTCPPNYPATRVIAFEDNTGAKVPVGAPGGSFAASTTRLYALFGKREVAEMQATPLSSGSLNGPVDSYTYQKSYQATLLMNAEYFLDFSQGTTSKLWVTMNYAPVGEYLTLAIPYPTGSTFTIYNDQSKSIGFTYKKVDSKAKLDTKSYYFDGTNGLLWVKFGSLSNSFLWVPRTNPFGPFINQVVNFYIDAVCPGGCNSRKYDPSKLSGTIDLSPPIWKRCGETIIGGHSKWTTKSQDKYTVFNGTMNSNWDVRNGNGGNWTVDLSGKVPNPLGTNLPIAMITSGEYIMFVRKDKSTQLLDPTPYSHLKITVKYEQDAEQSFPYGVNFWKKDKEGWDTDGPLTIPIEFSSPWFMESPPVNTTWKSVYIPLEQLGVTEYGNIAAFTLRPLFPARPWVAHFSEISFVNMEHSVTPLNGPQTCYSPNHCALTEKSTSSTSTTSSSTTSTTTSETTSASVQTTGTFSIPEEGETTSVSSTLCISSLVAFLFVTLQLLL